ncbi:MAG: hypothetical protein F4Z04_06945 [Acidobacteria bacterium]|nr:hypothetical protein [Acidobacteriota bacterium]
MTNGDLAASYLVKATIRLDVLAVLLEREGYSDRFSGVDDAGIGHLADVSAWLRENRELSFYGDEGFVPTERYTREDAHRAIDGARLAVSTAAAVIGERRP